MKGDALRLTKTVIKSKPANAITLKPNLENNLSFDIVSPPFIPLPSNKPLCQISHFTTSPIP